MHEKQMHDHAAFITVTYSDENIPPGHTLRHRDWQLFTKKLRRHCEREKIATLSSKLKRTKKTEGLFTHSDKPAVDKHSPNGEISQKIRLDIRVKFKTTAKFKINYQHTNIRFYMAGEYGEQTQRPHYHAAIFGYDFPDKKHWKTTRGGKLYTSERLDKLWGQGFTTVGELTFESAAYIARYITSKLTGPAAKTKYEYIDQETGEIINKEKEYNRMSLRPAIGATWLEKYTADVYPEGTVLARGHKSKAPKYYDKKYSEREPLAFEETQWLRHQLSERRRDDNTPERLRDKEQVKLAATQTLKRKLT